MNKTGMTLAASMLAFSMTTTALAEDKKGDPFTWGGDVRFRVVNMDEIPLSSQLGGTILAPWLYHRTRSRLWGRYQMTDNTAFKARVTNEFWDYFNDKDSSGAQPGVSKRFISEFVFDEFYLDFTKLLGGKLDLRIGRQALIYGTGKVILEGTPGDGSRTIYHNAVRASYKMPDYSVDLFAMANNDEDDFALHSKERQLAGYDGRGGGIYIKNNKYSVKQEYYYVFKHEDTHGDGNDADLHTVGARFMPKFSDRLSANIELATQWGERQGGIDFSDAHLFDFTLKYKLPVAESMKPVADLSLYYLSGDDPNTTDEEGWHQVWGQWPQFSELYVYSVIGDGVTANNTSNNFPGNYSNIITPSVGVSAQLTDKLAGKLRGHMILADTDDGPGTGKNRGALLASKLTYKMDKSWSGHMVYEFLNPGDYYAADEDNAHFARFELNYRF
ncbi:alginate export family protein [Magnetococcus sp. PR-3]|uniref:alginate export family protein n=1 Tax=Magnetococcus sp. PR-3 TaxID=3120355 RepID=UPI002FCDE484